MVTAPTTDRRPATSPFGPLADLGAAVGAELGIPVGQIAAMLSVSGSLIGEQQARAAIMRGRCELARRRMNPASLRPIAQASAPNDAAPPVPVLPQPQVVADVDPIEQLLLWAERGPQRAKTHAAKVRMLLKEIAALQQHSRRRWTRRQQAVGLPADATPTQRRAYMAEVRAWALRGGYSPSPNRSLSERIIRAFEDARAAQRAEQAALDGAIAAEPSRSRPD